MRHWRRLVIPLGMLLALTACSSHSTDGGSISATTTPATTRADAALLTPAGGKHTASGAPVKVGIINDEGGTAESWPEIRIGAQAAVAYGNQYLGGIAGRPVQLDVCESKGTPASSAACANQMIADHVVAVLHGIDSDSGTTTQTLMNAGIPVISTAPSSSQEELGTLSFSLTGGATAFIAAMGQWMAQQHYKTSVFFAENAPGGAALWTSAVGFLKKLGITTKLVLVEPGTADLTPQMDAAVQQHPDFYWMTADSGTCLSFMRAYRAAGSPGHFGLIGQCGVPQVVSAVSLAGAIEPTYAVPLGSGYESRLYRAVLSAYAPGTDPGGTAYVGYTMALGLIRAMHGLTGVVTAKTITAQLRAAKNVPLPTAPGVTFTCNGQQVPPFPAPCSDTVLITQLDARGNGTLRETIAHAASLFGS
jgi:branched-chain amino acid transport system substrate-binding protein